MAYEELEYIDGPYSGLRGDVWCALDRRLQKRVAVKILHTGSLDELQAQGRLLARCGDHPAIVSVLLVAEVPAPERPGCLVPAMIMEWLDGTTISQVDRVSWKDACKHLEQLLGAVTHLHELGVAHGDLHPGNIMITADGALKLIDLARTTSVSDLESGQSARTHELSRVREIMQLILTRSGDLPWKRRNRAIAALHQASSLKEVRTALRTIETWATDDAIEDVWATVFGAHPVAAPAMWETVLLPLPSGSSLAIRVEVFDDTFDITEVMEALQDTKEEAKEKEADGGLVIFAASGVGPALLAAIPIAVATILASDLGVSFILLAKDESDGTYEPTRHSHLHTPATEIEYFSSRAARPRRTNSALVVEALVRIVERRATALSAVERKGIALRLQSVARKLATRTSKPRRAGGSRRRKGKRR